MRSCSLSSLIVLLGVTAIGALLAAGAALLGATGFVVAAAAAFTVAAAATAIALGWRLRRQLKQFAVVLQAAAGGDLERRMLDVTDAFVREAAASLEAIERGLLGDFGRRAAAINAASQSLSERIAAFARMTLTFEANVTAIADRLGCAASGLSSCAETVVGSAGTTHLHVESVAAAATELTTSIAEISRQLSQAQEVSTRAESEAAATREVVHRLASTATVLGSTVTLIQEIAEKTNMLALNATIEAARAGTAGRSFAVVAAEVKALATQTEKATVAINEELTRIERVSGAAVTASDTIVSVVGRLNATTAAIAAAVEEQGAATSEISRRAVASADATRSVASAMGERAPSGATAGGVTVLGAMLDVTAAADRLRQELDTYLDAVGGVTGSGRTKAPGIAAA
jgi:methyl-accepting chemotaxis protein